MDLKSDAFPLLHLPEELILRIICIHQDNEGLKALDLISLDRTCHFFHDIRHPSGLSLTEEAASIMIHSSRATNLFSKLLSEPGSWKNKLHFIDGIMKNSSSRVSCGAYQTALVAWHGGVVTWGAGILGQLGDGLKADRVEPKQLSTLPRIVELNGEKLNVGPIVSVSAGSAHTLFLTRSGHVFSVGDGRYYQLGHGTNELTPTPLLVRHLLDTEYGKIVVVAAGGAHSIFVTEGGLALLTGNVRGHGRGFRIPLPCPGLETIRIVHVAAGVAHTALVSEEGHVYTMGNSSSGQLGHGDLVDIEDAKMVEALRHECVVRVAAGTKHTLCLTMHGHVYSFGFGENGSLGHGDDQSLTLPKKITALQSPLRIVQVAAGDEMSMFVSEFGVAYWCGTFLERFVTVPRLVHNDFCGAGAHTAPVHQLAVGNSHVVILHDDGAVSSLGHNTRGQCGIPPNSPHVYTHFTTVMPAHSHQAHSEPHQQYTHS
eukprot:TRINITY_DN8130_c0_g1::TRINITY_DN8130_c0_g1_i1::g.7205::m.7205 TRINITY_DN8130_c0_g1::TRINITY_DN8130_c0_g1_i1::g.7205  ORF type:complete len:485 (+),score=43.38,sp/Q9FN03/UVR8_ARATH/31.66/9e-34,sp/Q9FN03/UVR8_ARATH/29.77/8e-27,sp/Q9FN03/UVR8_ARATH/30.74/7e-22,sp/Q9FN03/UVR8_ARATH/31.58/3e-20,sp/Q9FN03/UVR8_ARATH/27.01/5e-08,RCC1/PF00415.13/2.2e+02,RCC1/PF00415.13/2.1e-07,RCC1/PF00415.13/3.3e-09,RCC1/PF00415.13/0.19,RCC1/PF00415.13/1.1e-08,RCC1/PF00415.13/1.2e-12,RCC1/PF00415.13/5.1e+02,RCC1/PF0041